MEYVLSLQRAGPECESQKSPTKASVPEGRKLIGGEREI